MVSLLLKLGGAALLAMLAYVCKRAAKDNKNLGFAWTAMSLACLAAAIVTATAAVAFTSIIIVPKEKFAVVVSVYGTKPLPPGKRIATMGETGPQAEIKTQGWYFNPFITIWNEVEYHDVFVVPPRMCAVVSAKDGNSPIAPFAPAWPSAAVSKMANDAKYFLTEGKGVKGQQSSVLTPGVYTLHPYLWEKPELRPGITVEQGSVGVIKSFIKEDEVDFGTWKRTRQNELKILTDKVIPVNGPKAQIVPVGDVGVWEEPLPNGFYYINTDCYRVTLLPVIDMPYEYKGGYTARHVDLDVGTKGEVTQTIRTFDVAQPTTASDSAITVRVQGFEVPVELRAIVQVTPLMAPYVVATLGIQADNVASTQEIVENRVLTPVLRTTLRNVIGGTPIKVTQKELILDSEGKPQLDKTSGELMVKERSLLRVPSLRDLAENRELIEQNVEVAAKKEAADQGIEVTQVRIAETSLPAEVTAAWKREEFATQQTKAFAQEELAQKQRQAVENAKATAEKQNVLVEAQMLNAAAQQKAQAKVTEAEGEKAVMLAKAEGQKAQAEVLGQDQTAKLQMFETVARELTTIIKDNPTLLTSALQNANKFVPTIVVNSSGSSPGGLEAPAVLLGTMLNPDSIKKLEKAPSMPAEQPRPVTSVE